MKEVLLGEDSEWLRQRHATTERMMADLATALDAAEAAVENKYLNTKRHDQI